MAPDLKSIKTIEQDLKKLQKENNQLKSDFKKSLFDSILKDTSSLNIIVDNKGKILNWSAPCLRTLNIDKTFLGKKYTNLLSSRSDGKYIDEIISNLFSTSEKAKNLKVKFQTKGNINHLYQISFSRLKDLSKQTFAIKLELKKEIIQSEETVYLSETFRKLADNSTDSIMVFDKSHRHLYVNPATQKLTGIPTKEFLGKTHEEIGFPEELCKMWGKAINRVFKSKKTHRIEFKLPNEIWIDWLITPEFDAKAKVIHAISIARDITELKSKSQEIIEINKNLKTIVDERTLELKKKNKDLENEISSRIKSEKLIELSQKYYSTLFSFSPSGIMLFDLNGNFIEVNNAYCNILGYSCEELIGQNIKNFIPANNKKVKSNIRDLKNGKVLRHTVVNNKKDGSICYLELHETLISTVDYGNVILVIANDATEKNIALQKTEQSEKFYKTLFDLSPNGIMLESLDGIILETNPYLCSTLGYSKEELRGMNIRELAEESIAEVENNLNRIKAGEFLKHIITNLKKDGTPYYMELREKKISLPDGSEGIIVLSNDITERKLYEDHLIEAKENAEKSNKFKSDFLAQMSHEIRSPINIILSFTNLIKDLIPTTLDEELITCFHSIDAGGKRIIRTIDMILNMSALQSGIFETRPEELDLREDILDTLLEEYKNSAKAKNIKLFISDKCENHKLFADKYSVTQLFSNLIDNAIKYTKSGSIELYCCNYRNKFLDVKVIDTGIGISESFIDELFDPFSQEETGYTRRYEGTGLGLALVKNYVELNSAQIFVESIKGEGTAFTIRFNKYI